MSIQEIFQIAAAIIFSLGGAGIIVFALSSWLGKVWASRILEDEKHEHRKEIEKYKKELGVLSTEHQIRFSKLHEKQSEAIAELYRKIVLVSNTTGILIIDYEHEKKITKEIKEQLKKSSDAGDELSSFYRDNEILFPPNICKLLDQFLKIDSSIWFEIGVNQYFPPTDLQLQKIIRKIKKLKSKIPKIKTALQKEFRKLLGV